ncbi:MAG: hypothetical protein F7B60_01285 [Desulfurococcales archaeon]|nr:hypothetical protein [Desulfurococcales archaeon]
MIESARKSRRKKIGLTPLVEEVTDRLIIENGYDVIGIPREMLRTLVQEIVEDIASQMSSKPKPGPVYNRIKSNISLFEKALTAKLAENLDGLKGDLVEFIVTRNPELSSRITPILYKKLVELNRDDLIEVLREHWSKTHPELYLVCPRCRFKSLTPDFRCLVCGYSPNEEEIREFNNIDRLLDEFIDSQDAESLKKLLLTGFFYFSDSIRIPEPPQKPFESMFFLTRRDKARVISRLRELGEDL